MRYFKLFVMKRFFYLLVAMCAMAFVGCSDDDDNGDEDNSKSKIVMETFDESVDLYLGTSKPGEIVKIDWGDGKVEEYKSDEEIEEDEIISCYPLDVRHDYANKDKHTITIEGANIVQFACFDGLTFLDVTKCTSLLFLNCTQNNNLTMLDLTKCTALTYLGCSRTNLSSLDVTKCTALTYLDCSGTNLSSLDVSKCTALTYLYCGYNNLSSLDVSGCTALERFDCGNNKLTSLEVSKRTALAYLHCEDNNLSSLNVSGCSALKELLCRSNNLSFLDVSKCTALRVLYCYNNNFDVSTLNKIYGDLPQVPQSNNDDIGSIYASGNPGYEASNKQIAIDKGWRFWE